MLFRSSHPMPFVFTKREIDHARSAQHPEQLLCLSFCCKEALLKAAGQAYDYTACEVLPPLSEYSTDTEAVRDIVLQSRLKEELRASFARYRSRGLSDDSREVISTVYLFGEERGQ